MRPICWFLAVVMFLEVSPLAAQAAWETVKSEEGQFTVEMPKQPDINRTRTRRGPGGVVRSLAVGCKTEGGVYFAYRIDLPAAVARGTEDRELSSVRDFLAEEWNGKVAAEKKVKAGLRTGRDFTVRGTPPEETGPCTIRVR